MGVAEPLLEELRRLGEVTYHSTLPRNAHEWLSMVEGADIISRDFYPPFQ